MSICRTCKIETDDFYASNCSECKSCVRARARDYRAANLERVREYDRQRGLDPRRKKAVKTRRDRYKSKKGLYIDRYHERHPEVRAAHTAVQIAIKSGSLKVKPCEWCGYAIGVHAHHEDYSKPLEVIWLCRPCHGQRHREINEERRRGIA